MLLLPSSSTDLRSRGTEKVAIYGVNSAGEGRGGCLEVAKLGFSLLPHCKFELEFLQFCSMDRSSAKRGTEKVAISGVNSAGEGRGACLEVPQLGFSLLPPCKFELDFLQNCSMQGIGRPSAPIINGFIMGEGSKI